MYTEATSQGRDPTGTSASRGSASLSSTSAQRPHTAAQPSSSALAAASLHNGSVPLTAPAARSSYDATPRSGSTAQYPNAAAALPSLAAPPSVAATPSASSQSRTPTEFDAASHLTSMSAYQPAAQPRSTSQQWQSQPPHLQQAQLAYQLHLQHQQLYQRQQEQQWQQSRQAEEDQRQQEAQRQEEEKRKEEARRQAEAKRQEEERKEMERYQYLDQYLDQYNRQYAAHSSQQVPSTTNGITPLQYPPKPPDDISAFSLRGASATDARTRTAAVQPSYQMPAMSSFNPAADSYAAYRAQASAQFGPYEATQPASNLPAPSDTGRPSGSNASTSTAPQVPGQPHASESNRTTNSSNRPKPRAAVPRASQQQHHGASSRQQHNAGNGTCGAHHHITCEM